MTIVRVTLTKEELLRILALTKAVLETSYDKLPEQHRNAHAGVNRILVAEAQKLTRKVGDWDEITVQVTEREAASTHLLFKAVLPLWDPDDTTELVAVQAKFEKALKASGAVLDDHGWSRPVPRPKRMPLRGQWR